MKSVLNCTFEEFINILLKVMFIALFIILFIVSFTLKSDLDKAKKHINKLEQPIN